MQKDTKTVVRVRSATISLFFALGAALCGISGCQTYSDGTMIHPYAYALDDEKTRKLSAMLDDFHDAAAKADSQRYFAHFARHATFLGTDATECWGMSEFKAFAKPYFDSGKGWTYTLVPGTRNFYRLDSEGDIVAFDELLDNAKLGQCRGSGVIQFGKIVQYNLTMTIPNDIAEDVAKQSRAHLEAPRK